MAKAFKSGNFVIYHVIYFIFFLFLNSFEVKSQTVTKNASEQIAKEMVSKIQTEVDPNFVYDYKQTKFVPAAGKSLLIMGSSFVATVLG